MKMKKKNKKNMLNEENNLFNKRENSI
jgi:hypothetical protein